MSRLARLGAVAVLAALLAFGAGAAAQDRERGDDRIVGGDPVKIEQYPWQVALVVRLGDSNTSVAAASSNRFGW
jgi:hypothetical protein